MVANNDCLTGAMMALTDWVVKPARSTDVGLKCLHLYTF